MPPSRRPCNVNWASVALLPGYESYNGGCRVDYCLGQACSNHGTCSNGDETYTCSCSTGYSGRDCFSCAAGKLLFDFDAHMYLFFP